MQSTLQKNYFSLLFLAGICFFGCQTATKEQTEQYIDAKSANDPELRWKEEFDMLKNPVTGKIPSNIRREELNEAATIKLKEEFGLFSGNAYTFQGPDNLGGRCRALAYDVRYNGAGNRVILAGGVSGGMFRSTDGGLNWSRVSSLNDIHNVTSIAQDPRPGQQNTWYFGTGESLGNSANGSGSFYWGFGIYKSTDNGITWNLLANTGLGSQFDFDFQFDFISRIAVNPVNGHVYAATTNSIVVSTNGGNNWTNDLGTFGGTSAGITDVTITDNGIVYAAIPGRGGASVANEGIWKKEAGSWTRIAGGGAPAWFNTGNSLGRIVLAITPSNQDIVYALYYNGITSDCNAPALEAEMGRYDRNTGLWTDLSANLPDEPGCLSGNDPFAVQGGYDLAIAVKPDNANVVFIGGTNAYRSTNGFTSSMQTTRIGGYTSAGSYAQYANHHADVHTFAFAPNNPNIMLCGTDGGLHEGDISQSVVSWNLRNNHFTTFQYYYAAMDPTAGSDKYIGGTQDNGTNYRNAGTNSHIPIFSGDGVSVGISSNNVHQYVGTQRGTIYRRLSTLNNGFINANLTPADLSSNRLFVTLFHLDPDNSNVLYYADFNELHRNSMADTVSLNATAANRMQQVTGVANTIGSVNIRSFATSRGAYDASASKLYFGTSDGRIYRLDNPRDCDPGTIPVQINSGAGMPSGAIMSIAINQRSSDTLMAVYSNYGITNIWFCGNATSANPTWTAIEGNLTLPSVRSAAIAISNGEVEYYVGTSTGLYSATTLNGNSTAWVKEGAAIIGNSVVIDLKIRPSDNRMLVATHGNGLFATDILLPVQMGKFEGQIVNGNSRLYWETLSESNNRGFDIEKSADGRSFAKIGFVPGNGTSGQRHSYSFTDPVAADRVQYYRLKQLDTDGGSKYSSIVRLTQQGIPLRLESVVNPMNTNLIFTLNDAPAKPLDVKLIDLSGRTVFNQKFSAGGSNIFRLNIAHLANNTYILLIQSEGLQVAKKVIKRM